MLAAYRHAVRYGRPLSVALVDIDDFKDVNDCFSHSVGDGVLRIVAQMFVESARASDCVARYGGEEFVLIMPEVNEAECRIACERTRGRIESHSWSKLRPGLRVTVSVGVAELRSEERPEDLLQSADALLYKAKKLGKNRVVGRPTVEVPK